MVNKHTPIKARGSLLERASEQFDFRKAIEQGAPVLPSAPAPTPAPPSEPVVAVDHPHPVPDAVAAPVAPVSRAAPVFVPKSFGGRYGRVGRDLLREAGLIVPDAVSYTNLDVYKRQVLQRKFCLAIDVSRAINYPS